ncbi:hypothetical protein CMALT394_630035 [Carnobacterium maltaromaticum]|nr:hypothetical protein CMALT394_630035 [Carnobacterium maltaromaticum]
MTFFTYKGVYVSLLQIDSIEILRGINIVLLILFVSYVY